MLTGEGCRQRQARLRRVLAERRLDGAAITHPRDIYYFTGLLAENKVFDFPSILYLGATGASWLGTWQADGEAVARERDHYPPGTFSTMNPDNTDRLAVLARKWAEGLRGKARQIGYQAEGGQKHLLDVFAGSASTTLAPIDDALQAMQETKDADEVECLRTAQRATRAGYLRATQIIRPGINELEVLAECQKAAMLTTGHPHYFGGDFRSGERGGPARDRKIEAGELYIIDAQADVAGYWSDWSRAWIVGGNATDLQHSVYAHLAGVLRRVPEIVKPGLSCQDFFAHIDALMREHPYMADKGLGHHGGHGIGLRAHEAPDINPKRGGTFRVGNTFTVEPGFYSPELRAGIRVENNFLLTENGVEVLSDFPLSLSLP